MNFRSRLFVATLLLARVCPYFYVHAKAQKRSTILSRIFKYDLDPQTGFRGIVAQFPARRSSFKDSNQCLPARVAKVCVDSSFHYI